MYALFFFSIKKLVKILILSILFYFDIDNIDIKFWLLFRSLPKKDERLIFGRTWYAKFRYHSPNSLQVLQCYHLQILRNKIGKLIFRTILVHLWKNLQKKTARKVWNCLRKTSEELQENFGVILEKNCRRNAKKFWKILEKFKIILQRSWKILKKRKRQTSFRKPEKFWLNLKNILSKPEIF